MDKEYFYLIEKEQKGPYTLTELKTFNISPKTLIWTEDFDSWVHAKEIDELNSLFKKTPPPPPFDKKKRVLTDSESKKNNGNGSKSEILYKIFGFFILLFALIFLIVYLVLDNKRIKLKNEIYSKIETITRGKTLILDGELYSTVGKLQKRNLNYKKINPLPSWWEINKLYQTYEATNGGFTIKQLKRYNDDLFQLYTIYSSDMGFKPTTNNINGFKLNVKDCYREAFEFFTIDDRYAPGSYTKGSYFDLTNFASLRNEYFYVKSAFPTPIQYSTINKPSHNQNISTDDWIVYYDIYGSNYTVTEKVNKFETDLLIYTLVITSFILFIGFVVLYSKPHYLRNLSLFGKRWKSLSSDEEILIFRHSFFGKHTFVKITDEKIVKGNLNFSDHRTTINLSTSDNELFYVIKKLTKDELILNDNLVFQIG